MGSTTSCSSTSTKCLGFVGVCNFDDWRSEEDEIRERAGPSRRERVLDTGRCHEGGICPEVSGSHGRSAWRRGGTFEGAALSPLQEDLHIEFPTVCRFLGVHSLWTQNDEGFAVQKLCPHGRWSLCSSRTTRASKLCAVVGMLSGLEGSNGDVEHYFPGEPPGLRAAHGEVEQAVSHGLAFAGASGRQREVGAFEQVGVASADRASKGREGPSRLGASKTNMGPHLQDAHRGWDLLGRECPQPSFGVDGSWQSRCSEDAGGESGHARDGGRSALFAGPHGEESRRSRKWRVEEAEQQGEEGSKEKENPGRPRRTGSAPGRTKGWWKSRERKRKIQRRGGAVVFRMEQQQLPMQRRTTRRRMPEQDQESAQVHEVWKPWTSICQLFTVMVQGVSEPEDGDKKEEREGDKKDRERQGAEDNDRSKRRRREGEDQGDRERENKREDEKPLDVEAMVGSFEDYLEKRVFTFVHHYSGREDVLSAALVEAGGEAGVTLRVIGVDRERDHGMPTGDLLGDEPFNTHLEEAKAGKIDGFHAGFPCSTFSRWRWRESPGMPRAVRSRMEPMGCKDNTVAEQGECDKGTIMMARSLMMSKAVEGAKKGKKIGPFSVLENPPPSDHPSHVSAWEMPEMKKHVEDFQLIKVIFNTCCYEPELEVGKRHFKPQQMVGSLNNISTLRGRCACGDARHEAVVGSRKSKASARYPKAMCEKYAKLVMDHFIRMAKSEYLDRRAKAMEIHLRKMRLRLREVESNVGVMTQQRHQEGEGGAASRRSSGSRTGLGEEEKEEGRAGESAAKGDTGREGREVEKGWKQGPGKFGVLKPSRAKKEDPSQHVYLGGTRNPAAAVRALPGAQSMGVRVQRSWERFIKMKPNALDVAVNYGTQQGEIDEELVKEWRRELKQLLGVEVEETTKLVEKGGYRSEVEAGLLEGWTSKTGDPDVAVAQWVRQGAPLGIEQKIACHGVFPVSSEKGPERESEEATTYLTRGDLINYASVEEDKVHAREELQRYEANGYMRRLTVEEANEGFKRRTLSKLGLILKEREDGSLKKRIVIDLRRSGGNSKAHLPERLLLPRPADCIAMTRELRAAAPKAESFKPEDRWGAEYAVVDITDAFMSFGLHPTEWGHALTPSTEANECLLFVAMLFGYKTAPLVFSRLAAQVARFVQAGLDPAVAVHQVYLDDSIFYMQGPLEVRDAALSYVLYTKAALGLRVSYKKGRRGAAVQWVGVKFELTQDGNLVLGLPTNFLQDTLKVLEKWKTAGYAPLKELRALAGRMSWTAGVLPRARWTVGVLYAVLHQEEDAKQKGKKDKKGLFPVRRLEQARAWLAVFLEVALEKPMRMVSLKMGSGPKVVITTDASPQGLGGVLSINGTIIQAFKSEVTEQDAERHSFTLGSSASQGVVESLSILVALKVWKAKIAPGVVELALQSDSITALALTQRLGAFTPALNHLGGEIGLVMEELCLEKVRPVHVPGAANGLADFLSRPEKIRKLSLPGDLKDVKILTLEPRSDDYFRLPLPKNNPTLWGCSEALPPHTVWDSLQ